ncbi:DUF6907 domain-containing protein [Streptomyces fimicarius]|uniref:DUF6907 domain-containing protein n=1 Tax=Streptomyces griseus TaxID=1911 RepID=UPI0036C008BC
MWEQLRRRRTAVTNWRSLPLAEDPFAELGSREVGVTVEMGSLSRRMGPTELRELAAVLVDYAETLNDLAVRLTTLRAER